jgi:spermidine dehydrogenase
MPGFKGMNLKPGSIARMGYTPAGFADTGGSESLHFPDGNATVARLLVRDLIPKAVPGRNAEDVVTARVDYSRLDSNDNPVRLRLNSTVIRVLHAGDPKTARQVAVTYVRDGQAYTARANGCVLACWNMMIPYLCPELPAAQKAALHDLVGKHYRCPVYQLLGSEEWVTHTTRALLHLDGTGVVRGVTGDTLMQRMALWTKLLPLA